MDLDSKIYLTVYRSSYNEMRGMNFREYKRIVKEIEPLEERCGHETPEMWCSHIRDPFKKILKENLGILSGNGYITMYGKLIESSDRVYGLPFNYIYCCM